MWNIESLRLSIQMSYLQPSDLCCFLVSLPHAPPRIGRQATDLVDACEVLRRGHREHRAFGQEYQVIPCDKEVSEEPTPCREVYTYWMNGCDCYNRYLNAMKSNHPVKGWKQHFFHLFLRICILNATWVLHCERNTNVYDLEGILH